LNYFSALADQMQKPYHILFQQANIFEGGVDVKRNFWGEKENRGKVRSIVNIFMMLMIMQNS